MKPVDKKLITTNLILEIINTHSGCSASLLIKELYKSLVKSGLSSGEDIPVAELIDNLVLQHKIIEIEYKCPGATTIKSFFIPASSILTIKI